MNNQWEALHPSLAIWLVNLAFSPCKKKGQMEHSILVLVGKDFVMWGRTYSRRRRKRDVRRAAERAEGALGAHGAADGSASTGGGWVGYVV